MNAVACPSFATPNPEHVKEVQRRTDAILKSGNIPEWIFLCELSNGILTLRPAPGAKPIVLLFSGFHAAQDYIRATKATAEVRAIKFDSVPSMAPGWIAAGAEGFILNRCPRCNIANAMSATVLQDSKALFHVWAVYRALQLQQGSLRFSEFRQFQSTARPRARAALEMIRDHIDCGIPYLFELLAFFARMDQDEAAKASALERLKEFGPQFANWETRWDSLHSSSVFAKSLATAMVGLAQSVGVELTPRASD